MSMSTVSMICPGSASPVCVGVHETTRSCDRETGAHPAVHRRNWNSRVGICLSMYCVDVIICSYYATDSLQNGCDLNIWPLSYKSNALYVSCFSGLCFSRLCSVGLWTTWWTCSRNVFQRVSCRGSKRNSRRSCSGCVVTSSRKASSGLCSPPFTKYLVKKSSLPTVED